MARDEKLSTGTEKPVVTSTTATNPYGFKISELPIDVASDEGVSFSELDDRDPITETYFIVVKDHFEIAAAREWMFANAPKVPMENLRTTLPLQKLSPRSKVFVLDRKGTTMRPVAAAQPVTGRNREGFLAHEDRPASALAEEMGAYGPVDVGQFFKRTSRLAGGGLVVGDFIQALAHLVHPHGIGWMDAPKRANDPPGTEIYIKAG